MGASVSVDRRIERTRDQLRLAVLELAESQDISALTVHDITRRAGVNRATFYQHYRDKDELIEEAIEVLLKELFDSCAPVIAGIEHLLPDEIHPSVIQMFNEVARRSALYGRLIGHGGSAYFIRRFQTRNEELALQVMQTMDVAANGASIPVQARAYFAASATTGMLAYWLEHGQSERAETVAAWYWRLLRPVWFETFENEPEPLALAQ